MTAARSSVALDGRALGKRGAATRRRLLDATGARLESSGLRDLPRVVDIAREVGTSPATFYQYFRDVPEAVLALAEAVGEQTAPLVEFLDEPWHGEPGLESVRRLVDGFLRFWDDHRAILRTRNLAAQEGDQRFRDVRNASLRPITEGLSRKVAENEVPGVAPYAAAAALVAMMERMAAFHGDLEAYGVSRSDVVETTAHIVFQTVTGGPA